MTHVLTQERGNYVIKEDAKTHLVIGPHDFDRQWGAWYVDMLNSREIAPWPITGLRVHAAFDSVNPSWLFTWNGLPVGTVGWNGLEWWWYTMDHWSNTFGVSEHIEVDETLRLKFQDERQVIARKDETVRDVLTAELEGRIRLYRDETADMALLYGKVKGRKRGKLYDEQRVDHTCTGYVEEDGAVSHDGNSCPVHEL